MAHGYRILKKWDQWLSQQFLGRLLLQAEEKRLSALLRHHYGKHALLIGTTPQQALLKTTSITCRTLLTPIAPKDGATGTVEGDLHELPFLTASMDLVILPHTLSLIDNPRQLLSEACRIVKPEGLIVITGFNPTSLWGLAKLMIRQKAQMPWTSNFIQAIEIKRWLKLADFKMEKHTTFLHTLPVNHPSLYRKMAFFDIIGKKCFPKYGAVYILVARAKVIPLTPIKMKWKQPFTHPHLSTTFTGHVARS